MSAPSLPIPPGVAPIPPALRRLGTLVRVMVLLGAAGLLWLPVWLLRSPDAVHCQAQSVLGLGAERVTIDSRAVGLYTAAHLPSIAVALFMLWQLWRLF